MAEPTKWFPFVSPLVKDVQRHVMQSQDEAMDRAEAMSDKALKVIEAINQALPRLGMTGAPPQPVKAPDLRIGNINLPELGKEAFGTVDAPRTGDFVLGAVADVPRLQVDDFRPAFEALALPPAPPAFDPGAAPQKPVVTEPQLPPVPVLERPNRPQMVEIEIPDFEFPQLPAFDAKAPQFHGTAVSAVLQWTETPYELVILDEQMEVLRRMWAGGTGLPPAVEQALWERAASREDVAAQRETAQAMTEFSARGYSLPPGALVARVDDVRQQAGLRKIGLGREVLIKVADTHIENLRFACTQAVAAEQVLVSIWQQTAERAFQAAKTQVDSELALLNAQIAIFNAQQSAYATEANVYKARLEGALARVQVYRAQIDAAVAKGQINEQAVKMFEAMTRAMLSDVEVYKTRMEGARVHSEVQKGRIDMFRAEVQAWAEQLQARKLQYDAYKVQVEGETSKAQMLEAQSRAYAAYVQGRSAVSEVDIKNQQAAIAKQELRLRAYTAQLERDKLLVQQQTAVVQANAEAHRANTQRFVAAAQAETAVAEGKVRVHEATLRTNMAVFETEMKRYQADIEHAIRTAQLQVEALKGVAQSYATLAAGAMAGISLSASAGSSVGLSGSSSENINYQL